MIRHRLGTFFAISLFVAANAPAAIRYVDLNSASPTPPYTSWVTAATNIQDAVDAASFGDQILVTNGVYQTGGKAVFGTTNRVTVDKSVAIQSVNGPLVTLINGSGAVRCVYLTNGTLLTGFTLTNGFAGSFYAGGGVGFGDFGSDAIVSNCVIVGCFARYGGGAGTALPMGGYQPLGGTLVNCIVRSNFAGPVMFAFPGVGGGAYGTTLINCTLEGNFAGGGPGGGTSSSRLTNCVLIANSSSETGGGAVYSSLVNCTLASNSASVAGGATAQSTLRNCIAYYNRAPDLWDSSATYSCTESAVGEGNITNAPVFVDRSAGNFRLQSNSSCINAGNNAYAVGSTDLDGRPRIMGGTVDIGAYEFQPDVSGLFLGWLQQNSLSTDGSADYLDSDSDLMNNWQEWIAGTVPTDGSSALRMLNPISDGSGITVSWQSVSNRTYFLERATNLGAQPSFSLIASNLVGQTGTTSLTDTNAVGPGPFFYRVGVR